MKTLDSIYKEVEDGLSKLKERYSYPTHEDAGYYDYHSIEELVELVGLHGDGIHDTPFSSLSQLSDFKTWQAEAWFTDIIGEGETPKEALIDLVKKTRRF